MAKFYVEDAENYGGGQSSFFSLKDDGNTAKVRFLLNDINDLYGVSVHEIEVDGKKVDVECLRAYNEPIANCPLCAAGYQPKAKVFVPLYDEGSQTSKIWTRSRRFFDKMSSLSQRYSPLVSTSMEIERIGKRGDPKTSYEIYPGRSDNKQVSDFPGINPEGTAYQSKTYEELESYLRTGTFENSAPQRRSAQQSNQAPVRRTPARNTDEEVF